FMMVNMTDGTSETIKSATKFIENAGYTFPVYFDTEESALYAYYVYSIPATYFINSDGTLAAYAHGMINEEALTKGIELMK
ncbi:MAG: TlpA family protein disulfide reductase, partial [Clostridia bacterium]|nr:TlpA family protein disulfide reductase [Clostridia bacterium]